MMPTQFQMEQAKGTIETILQQIEQNTIKIGHIDGHFISNGQIAAIRSSLGIKDSIQEEVEGTSSVEELADREAVLRSERFNVSKQISAAQAELKLLSGDHAVAVNLKLGKLLSQRAKIDKALKGF